MNILQIEDTVKGLPDERLMSEAQAPTGQVPQYLVISEIQRRSDMRKRYEAEQQEPKGTVASQIMGQAQPQQMQPPPQGMQPSPQQMPQQMAGGGITRVRGYAGGGQFPVTDMSGTTWQVPRGGYDTDQMAYEAYMQKAADDEYQRQLAMLAQGPMPPDYVSSGFNPENVSNVRFDQSGSFLPEEEESGGLWSLLTGINQKMQDIGLPDIPGTGEPSYDETGGGGGGWDDTVGPKPTGNRSIFGAAPSAGMIGDFFKDKLGAFAPRGGNRQGTEAEQIEQGINAINELDEIAVDTERMPETGVGALLADINKKNDLTVQGKSKIQVQGSGSANEELMALRNRQRTPMPDFADLIADQRKDAYSGALVQLGAGIANNDLPGGLSRAGDVAMAGKSAARDLDAKARAAKYQGEQGELDRDISILSRAAQIEAIEFRAAVDKQIESGRSLRETKKTIMDMATTMMPADDGYSDPALRSTQFFEILKSLVSEDAAEALGFDFLYEKTPKDKGNPQAGQGGKPTPEQIAYAKQHYLADQNMED